MTPAPVNIEQSNMELCPYCHTLKLSIRVLGKDCDCGYLRVIDPAYRLRIAASDEKEGGR